jgi:hypothetical protein
VELPVEAPAPAPSTPQPDISWLGASAIALVILYSVTLAAGGGYVFYASIRPVTIDLGYGEPLIDFPWSAAYALLAIAWAVGSVVLLIVGLIYMYRAARDELRPAVAWVGALAASAAIGYLIVHGYGLLFSAYPKDLDGTALGPSRWAPGAPYWLALIATAGQLALGVVMTALIIAPALKRATAVKPDTAA